MLNEKLDGDISIDKIHFQPFNTLLLKGVTIIDKNPAYDVTDPEKERIDTFFRAGLITARFSYKGLFKEEGIHINEALVEDAQMNLVLEDAEDGDRSTDNLSRIFRLKPSESTEANDKEIFFIRDVRINDMGFSMISFKSRKTPYRGGICWDDLDIDDIHLAVRNMRFKGGVMSGQVDALSFFEKSGFNAEHMSGTAKVGNGKTIVEDLVIKDSWSDLHLPLFMMSYRNTKDFADFINAVRLDGVISESHLNFKTLTYFAPELEGNTLKAAISGKVSGPVCGFDITDLKISTDDGNFTGTVNGSMTGLPDITETLIDAKISGLSFTADGMGKFLSKWIKGNEINLGGYADGVIFLSEINAKGNMNSLDIKAGISSLIGKLAANARIENIVDPARPIKIKGTAGTQDLDLGRIIGADIIGPTSLRTGITAEFRQPASITIDSLFVDRLLLNGYDYSGIMAAGSLSENMFNGRIIASDPSLNAWLQGGFALSSKTQNARYQFYANISDADLHALNIDKRGRSKLRFSTNANFTKTSNGNILGDIDIADLIFTGRDSTTNIGNINLTSHSTDDIYKMRLRSQFADGSFTGTAPITRFVKDLISTTARKELPALFKTPGEEWAGNSYSLMVNTHDTRKILSFIMPGAYINKGTTISLNIDKDGHMKTEMMSQRLALGADNLQDIKAYLDNHNGKFSGEITSNQADIAGFTFKDNSIQLLADDNHFGLRYSYDNKGEMENRGELVINGNLSRQDDVLNAEVSLLPSTLSFRSKIWRILPSSLKISGKDLQIDSLEVASGDQRIYAHGGTSTTGKDTLTLGLYRFDLTSLAPIIGSDLDIQGITTGNAMITSPMEEKGLLADIVCESAAIAGESLGTLKIGSIWNEEFDRFDISLKNEYQGNNNISLNAEFTPRSKILDANVSLDSLSLKYAEPFLKDVFSQMGGYVSGEIRANGPISSLNISSRNARLDNALLKVDFTNVPYYADGTFHINEDGVHFDDIQIRDRYNGNGSVEGGIRWSHFRDIVFDTRIKVRNIEGINLASSENKGFYGNVFGTGRVSITGPINSLVLTADAVTAKTGTLHIPMSGTDSSGEGNNLLKFKEPESLTDIDPYEAMMAKMSQKTKSQNNFLVKLKIDVSTNVEAFLELDSSGSNILSGQGNGLIELETGEDIFNIYGDYTLSRGTYSFSALGLVNRVFNIQNGSSISFSGDILQSVLDIDAVYNTKTSLSTLLADNSSVANRRNVECGIHITDKLANPRLEFSIDIPDLNPMIKSRVESALSTEDKVQKQFLSLLLSNSFLPDEQSGIVNNSSMFYSNVTEAMANQLSNILHKLDIPLDLGLKYQPTDQGSDLFDVAVSTQLFNNRVVVNGNIGNKQYEGGGVQNDVVGDLDIEIKINRSGTIRLNLFSHSADQYSNFLDNSQRNGAGIMLQTEFNSIRQLLKKMFSNKKKREQLELEEIQETISGEKTELTISADDKH